MILLLVTSLIIHASNKANTRQGHVSHTSSTIRACHVSPACQAPYCFLKTSDNTQSMAWQKDRRSLSFFISLSFSPSLHYHSDLFKHAVPSEHSKELIWLFFKCLQWKGTSQGCASSCGQRSLSVLLASENRRYSLLQVALV